MPGSCERDESGRVNPDNPVRSVSGAIQIGRLRLYLDSIGISRVGLRNFLPLNPASHHGEKLAVIGGLHGDADVGVKLKVLNQFDLELVHLSVAPFAVRAFFLVLSPARVRACVLAVAIRLGLAGTGRYFPGLEPPERLLLVIAGTDNLGHLTLLAYGLGRVADQPSASAFPAVVVLRCGGRWRAEGRHLYLHL